MSVIATALWIAVSPGAVQTKPYRDNALGLIFEHPTAWTVKNERYSTDFSFPLADGTTAVVQLFRTSFRQEKAAWQQIQTDINGQLKRRVARQWEEQILGVPLLMTKIEYSEGGKDVAALIGLLYTATQDKLNFRLVASAGAIDEAEAAWRNVMLSLRTTNGELPIAEDPTRPLPNPVVSGTGRPITTLKPGEGPVEPVRTSNVSKVTKFGAELAVFLPEGWTLEAKEGKMTLLNSSLKGSVELQLFSGGRSLVEPTVRAASKESFEQFSVVTVREDQALALTKAGCAVAGMLRSGTTKEGESLIVWHIVGNNETFIWRLDYTTKAEKDLSQDRKAIDRLRDYFAVEIAR